MTMIICLSPSTMRMAIRRTTVACIRPVLLWRFLRFCICFYDFKVPGYCLSVLTNENKRILLYCNMQMRTEEYSYIAICE